MKQKTTIKEVKRLAQCYKVFKTCGANLQNILEAFSAEYYLCGGDGWKCDVYIIESTMIIMGDDTIKSVGGKKLDYWYTSELEKEYKKIIEYKRDWKYRKETAIKILKRENII